MDIYTTDAKIARYQLRVLEDDRKFFPRYDAVLLYRLDVPQRFPEAWARLPPEARRERRWVLAATAHPAKFREIVEPLIGRTVPVPETLAKLFARPAQCVEIDADGCALRALLEQGK